jgi:hypothetical protein
VASSSLLSSLGVADDLVDLLGGDLLEVGVVERLDDQLLVDHLVEHLGPQLLAAPRALLGVVDADEVVLVGA